MSNEVLCSFVVPIYKGKQYVNDIMDMVCRSAENYLSNNSEGVFEVVFINDYPDETVELKQASNTVVRQILHTNTQNCGIHSSRIRGAELANGKYIVFLDQDDRITEDYLSDQMALMKDKDLVICNGINYGEAIYQNLAEMKNALLKEHYINGNNLIVSPGQVMLKKEIIPEPWTDNIVHYNCSDDYFLWTLILSTDAKWGINEKLDFLHRCTDDNTSKNENNMYHSMCEVLEYLDKIGIFKDYSVKSDLEKKIGEWNSNGKRLEKSLLNTKVLNAMLFQKNNQMSIADYFEHLGYKSVAIYGYGYLGKRLYDELKQSTIRVSAIFDKKRYSIDDIFFYKIGDCISEMDAIIVTVSNQFDEIANELHNHYLCDIIPLQDIIFNETPWYFITNAQKRGK